SSCRKKISLCYPVVEAATGVLTLMVYKHFQYYEKAFFIIGVYFIFLCSLIVITGIDLRYFIIPDVISLPGIVIGILFSFLLPEIQGKASHLQGLLASFLSAATGGGILLLIALIGTLIFRKEAMGMGDIKLVAMFGAFMGIKLTLLSIFLASLVGSLGGGLLMAAGKAKMQSRIPFGPYLATGAVISLFYGEKLLSLYVHFITGGL
ncbi:MAG: prepilin peptidase, partial [Candidatus Aureabacteria bacterium]|nr:prepilin peptidase [Candidatus Auribacterota bacterium]